MPLRATETISDAGRGLDLLRPSQIARHLIDAQSQAILAVEPVMDDLVKAADMMAETLQNGGSLIYGAAGSSGLMAAADALELPGTFGLDPDRIHILMAGGQPTSSRMPGATEDDTDQVEQAAKHIHPDDCVIVVTASGSTPYAVALARAARAMGAQVIGMANTPGATLFEHSDLAICLATPPEILAGSTRLGAGTAQKVALNTMSTLKIGRASCRERV